MIDAQSFGTVDEKLPFVVLPTRRLSRPETIAHRIEMTPFARKNRVRQQFESPVSALRKVGRDVRCLKGNSVIASSAAVHFDRCVLHPRGVTGTRVRDRGR